jgi:hypothetical protein
MPRPLRFIPENALVDSPELTDLLLGIIGKAQSLYGMTIHAFVFLSTHAHFLLSPSSAGQLALFMQFVNANVAKEAGRLHDWRERLWSRRYRTGGNAMPCTAIGPQERCLSAAKLDPHAEPAIQRCVRDERDRGYRRGRRAANSPTVP